MQEIPLTFEALWDQNLLQSVLEGPTQNNKALNHLVWHITPTKLIGGPEAVSKACTIAVSLFNMGARTVQTMLRRPHMVVGSNESLV